MMSEREAVGKYFFTYLVPANSESGNVHQESSHVYDMSLTSMGAPIPRKWLSFIGVKQSAEPF